MDCGYHAIARYFNNSANDATAGIFIFFSEP
jgi:hypothetical protein